jgi:hypothetical protein
MRPKHQRLWLLQALSNSADATSTVSFGQARASSNDSLGRPIRRIHSSRSIAGSTRSRNSTLKWRDHASSPAPAVANTPRRQRDCAAPCCSPPQTSFCERASRRSLSCGAFASSLCRRSRQVVGLGSHPQSKQRPDIVIMADRNTLSPEFALVAKPQPLELSTPLRSFRFPSGGCARLPGSVCSAINAGRAETTKSSQLCSRVGNNTNANVSC